MNGYPEAIAPGATTQLVSLLAAVAGPAVLLLALVAAHRWWTRRAPVSPVAGGQAEGDRAGSTGPAQRLLGVMLLLALVLPTAVAVRQLWPHPDLGWRLAVIWLVVLLVPATSWLATHARRPRP
jgi:uncharacterized iron-regulated membrane protein